ncbi:MAG: hypothetical protein KBD62_37365 [Kofleriaceae bacterium]|nr:hypothetical protein [Kofleriaceae bacterium]
MRICVSDTGREASPGIHLWSVSVDGRRLVIEIAWGSGFVTTRGPRMITAIEAATVREAVWRAICPSVDYCDEQDSVAEMRKVVAGLTRCLELRQALRGVKLPRLKP